MTAISYNFFVSEILESAFHSNFKNSIVRLLFHIIVHFLCVNIVPVLMILNNRKIVIHAKNKFISYDLNNAVGSI